MALPTIDWLTWSPVAEMLLHLEETLRVDIDRSGDASCSAHFICSPEGGGGIEAAEEVGRRLLLTAPEGRVVLFVTIGGDGGTTIRVGHDRNGRDQWELIQTLSRVVKIIFAGVGLVHPTVGGIGVLVGETADLVADQLHRRSAASTETPFRLLVDALAQLRAGVSQVLVVARLSAADQPQSSIAMHELAFQLSLACQAAGVTGTLLGGVTASEQGLATTVRLYRLPPVGISDVQLKLGCSFHTARALVSVAGGVAKSIAELADMLGDRLHHESPFDAGAVSQLVRARWMSSLVVVSRRVWPRDPAVWGKCAEVIEAVCLCGGSLPAAFIDAHFGQATIEHLAAFDLESRSESIRVLSMDSSGRRVAVSPVVLLSSRHLWAIASGSEIQPRDLKRWRVLEAFVEQQATETSTSEELQEAALNAWMMGRDDLATTLRGIAANRRQIDVVPMVDRALARLDQAVWGDHPALAIRIIGKALVLCERAPYESVAAYYPRLASHCRRFADSWPSARDLLLQLFMLESTRTGKWKREATELILQCDPMTVSYAVLFLFMRAPEPTPALELARVLLAHLRILLMRGSIHAKGIDLMLALLVDAVHNCHPIFEHPADCEAVWDVVGGHACCTGSTNNARLMARRARAQGDEIDLLRWTSRAVRWTAPMVNSETYSMLGMLVVAWPDLKYGTVPALLYAAGVVAPREEAWWWWYSGTSFDAKGLAAIGQVLAHWVRDSSPSSIISDWARDHPLAEATGGTIVMRGKTIPLSARARDDVLEGHGFWRRAEAVDASRWRLLSCDNAQALQQYGEDAPEGCSAHSDLQVAVQMKRVIDVLCDRAGLAPDASTAWETSISTTLEWCSE